MAGEHPGAGARPPQRLRRLGEILGALPERLVQSVRAGDQTPWPEMAVSGITADSRQVRPGWIFVAVRGNRRDGHEFVPEAIRRGACAVVVDRPGTGEGVLPAAGAAALVVVRDSRTALSHMAAAYLGHPSRSMTMIGVTGTVGKTSTALFTRQILEASGRRTGAVGSLGIWLDGRVEPSPLTTPDPVTLQRALRSMLDEGIRHAVVEVSSHALLQHRADAVRFAAGVVTAILAGEHADSHPTFESYLRAKRHFLSLMEPSGFVAFDAGNPHAAGLMAFWRGRRVAFRLAPGGEDGPDRQDGGRGGEACVAGRVLAMWMGGTRLRLEFRPWPGDGPGGFEVDVPVIGEHAAYNVVAACAVAAELGVPLSSVHAGAAAIRPLRRRMEVIYRGRFTALDDTTGHPVSFHRLFEAIERLAPGRLVLLVAVRGRRGAQINVLNAAAIRSWMPRLPVAAVVVTQSEEVVEERDRATPQERGALVDGLSGLDRPVIYRSRLDEALREAVERVRDGDLLVLAGAQALDPAAEMLRRLLGAGVR